MISTICLVALLIAPAGEPPHVEVDFTSSGAGDWKGKRFAEIIPADTLKRIVRIGESGFSRAAGMPGGQADDDAFLAHLLGSNETAKDSALGGNEVKMTELIIASKDGVIVHIEVVGRLGSPPSPGAILLRGKGRGARIDVNDFKIS